MFKIIGNAFINKDERTKICITYEKEVPTPTQISGPMYAFLIMGIRVTN